MGKYLSGCVAALTVTFVLCTAVFAKDFVSTRSYNGSFDDVESGDWYAGDVKSVYELGLVEGASPDTFLPDSQMTVAQAITIVSRINSIYFGTEIPVVESSHWYDMYVAYANDKNITQQHQFDSYDRNILRHEMSSLVVAALPDECFKAVNKIEEIPDVDKSKNYATGLLKLYNAGVLTGSDAYGVFRPDTEIKRCEVAAIINRVAVPENRRMFSLLKPHKDAFLICEVNSFNKSVEGGAPGWYLDNRGGIPKMSLYDSNNIISDVSNTESTALARPMNVLSSGVVTLGTSVTILAGFDGFKLEFLDESKNDAYVLETVNGSFCIRRPDGTYKTVLANALTDKETKFNIVLDLDKKAAKTYINYTFAGESELLSDSIAEFRFASTDKAQISYAPGYTLMYANYNLYDNCKGYTTTDEPFLWNNVSGEAKISRDEIVLDEGEAITRSFDALDGKACFEAQFILPTGGAGCISFGDAIKLEAKDSKLYANSSEFYTFTPNMWYRLRVEADLSANKADVLLNGQKVLTVNTNGKTTVDKVSVRADAYMKLINIRAFGLCDHYDYVPIPTPTTDDGYYVGLNVCSLWREGTHAGWACITPFDEERSVIGYYDEGSPESADWEIKFMTEHGIDFQAFCWYADQSNAPIRTPNLSYQLNEGYQYARYSNMMKYCLLWEAANAAHPQGSSAFRKYFVPYWIENYFCDSRYMAIDNKAVMCVFGASRLITDFGSPAGVKEEFDYLRSEVSKLGYDGMIILACGTDSTTLRDCGFDGCYAYNWGTEGYRADINRNSILSSQSKGYTYTVPTISVGFNNIPWGGARHPNMSLEDYSMLHNWVKDTYLTTYPEQEWQKKLAMLSTWNEYGEGTYIMPSGLNGFGYLDVLREVYSGKSEPHTDVVPTEKQLERVTRCYPQSYRLLRRYGNYVPINDYQLTQTIECSNPQDFSYSQYADAAFSGDGFSGITTGLDPTFAYKNEIGTPCRQVDCIRVYAKIPKGEAMQIFFTTDIDTVFTEAKSVRLISDSDEIKGYDFDVSIVTGWNGNLRQLRFDSCANSGRSVCIQKFEFLRRLIREDMRLFVNEIELDTYIRPEQAEDGEIMYPFDPVYSVYCMLGLHYEWDYDTGILTVMGNGHTVTVRCGSAQAEVDGVITQLDNGIYVRDNIPMLPIKKLCGFLDYAYCETDSGIKVETQYKDAVSEITQSGKGCWEFNVLGSNEGWNSTNVQLLTLGGNMRIVNNSGGDPIVYSKSGLSIVADNYKRLDIRVKYKCESDKTYDEIGFYFITNRDSKWNEAKHVRCPLKPLDSGENFIEYSFDLSDYTTWADTITQLRFDPFNQPGTMYVDYIRLVPYES